MRSLNRPGKADEIQFVIGKEHSSQAGGNTAMLTCMGDRASNSVISGSRTKSSLWTPQHLTSMVSNTTTWSDDDDDSTDSRSQGETTKQNRVDTIATNRVAIQGKQRHTMQQGALIEAEEQKTVMEIAHTKPAPHLLQQPLPVPQLFVCTPPEKPPSYPSPTKAAALNDLPNTIYSARPVDYPGLTHLMQWPAPPSLPLPPPHLSFPLAHLPLERQDQQQQDDHFPQQPLLQQGEEQSGHSHGPGRQEGKNLREQPNPLRSHFPACARARLSPQRLNFLRSQLDLGPQSMTEPIPLGFRPPPFSPPPHLNSPYEYLRTLQAASAQLDRDTQLSCPARNSGLEQQLPVSSDTPLTSAAASCHLPRPPSISNTQISPPPAPSRAFYRPLTDTSYKPKVTERMPLCASQRGIPVPSRKERILLNSRIHTFAATTRKQRRRSRPKQSYTKPTESLCHRIHAREMHEGRRTAEHSQSRSTKPVSDGQRITAHLWQQWQGSRTPISHSKSLPCISPRLLAPRLGSTLRILPRPRRNKPVWRPTVQHSLGVKKVQSLASQQRDDEIGDWMLESSLGLRNRPYSTADQTQTKRFFASEVSPSRSEESDEEMNVQMLRLHLALKAVPYHSVNVFRRAGRRWAIGPRKIDAFDAWRRWVQGKKSRRRKQERTAELQRSIE